MSPSGAGDACLGNGKWIDYEDLPPLDSYGPASEGEDDSGEGYPSPMFKPSTRPSHGKYERLLSFDPSMDPSMPSIKPSNGQVRAIQRTTSRVVATTGKGLRQGSRLRAIPERQVGPAGEDEEGLEMSPPGKGIL